MPSIESVARALKEPVAGSAANSIKMDIIQAYIDGDLDFPPLYHKEIARVPDDKRGEFRTKFLHYLDYRIEIRAVHLLLETRSIQYTIDQCCRIEMSQDEYRNVHIWTLGGANAITALMQQPTED